MIAVGSCNGDVTSTILQTIMEKNDTELKDSYAHWLPLGLGLNHLGKNCHPHPSESLRITACSYVHTCKAKIAVYLLYTGKGEAIETTLAALQVVPEPFRSFANTLVDICAYAGELQMLLPFKCFDWQKIKTVMEPASVALKVKVIWLQATDGSLGKTELNSVSNAFFHPCCAAWADFDL